MVEQTLLLMSAVLLLHTRIQKMFGSPPLKKTHIKIREEYTQLMSLHAGVPVTHSDSWRQEDVFNVVGTQQAGRIRRGQGQSLQFRGFSKESLLRSIKESDQYVLSQNKVWYKRVVTSTTLEFHGILGKTIVDLTSCSHTRHRKIARSTTPNMFQHFRQQGRSQQPKKPLVKRPAKKARFSHSRLSAHTQKPSGI